MKLAYINLRKVYGYFSYTMCNADFQSFLSPSNIVGRLLQAHFVAIQLIMSPVTKKGNEGNPSTENGTFRWIEPVSKDIPADMREYFKWPLSVANAVKRDYCVRNQIANNI